MSKLMNVSMFLVVCILVAAAPVRAEWVENGARICLEPEMQIVPHLVSDGVGGAIIVWGDDRNDLFDYAVYAQRIDAQGDTMWAAEGVLISSVMGSLIAPATIADGAGGAIIVWTDNSSGDYDVFAQRIDADGTAIWTPGGISICSQPNDQRAPVLVTDGVDGAIISWQDRRSGPDAGDLDIYAQRVNAAGAIQWAVDGIPVCAEAEYQYGPCMAADGAGGAIVIWIDGRGSADSDLYAQRINGAGAVQWTVGGVPFCTFESNQYTPDVMSDGAGGAIAAWEDERGAGVVYEAFDIYSQRIDGSGAILWAADGVPLCAAANVQQYPEIVTDGSGGAIVTWMDERSGLLDVYAQRVNGSGIPEWTADGIPVCAYDGIQMIPAIIPLLSGGAIITWWDNRDSDDNTDINSPRDIYAQRIDGFGSLLWTASGVVICNAPEDQLYSQLTTDGAGGAIIGWHDWRNGTPHVYAQRVNASGEHPVACELQSWSTGFFEDRVSIEWSLSEVPEDPEFVISRVVPGDDRSCDLSSDVERTGDLTFACIDRSVAGGSTYSYTVGIKEDGDLRVLFESGPVEVPVMPAQLSQNFPNPFNPATTISYYLPSACKVRLAVFDAAGHMVVTLVEGEQEPGHHGISWSGLNGSGDAVVSGVYFYKLFAGKETLTRKMVLLK